MNDSEAFEDWEERGIIPLGLVGYDPEQNTLVFRVLREIADEDFKAIMSKVGINDLVTNRD